MMYVDASETSFCQALPVTLIPVPRQSPSILSPRHSQARTTFLFVVLLFCSLLSPALSQSVPNSFYPFGENTGDRKTERSDDGGSGKIRIQQPFHFFGQKQKNVYVNNNGVVSFLENLRTYRPKDFPLENTPIIAPYWADVDIDKVGGQVWYRETQAADILEQANADVHIYSSAYKRFQGTWAFIATWDNVGYYGAVDDGVNKRNTFQCVLVSDGILSFVVLIYDRIEWTTGANSQGDSNTGLGGRAAQAGFNAGDGVNYYEIEGAGTNRVLDLNSTSNVCIPGRWIFRVDSPEIYADSGSLFLVPSSGSILGDFEVTISGPCFPLEAAWSIQGRIMENDVMFPCVRSSNESNSRTVQCVMPTVFSTGPVSVSLVVDGEQWNYTGGFMYQNPGLTQPTVIRHDPDDWRAGQGSVSVSWQFSLSSAELESAVLEVVTFRVEGGRPQLVTEHSQLLPSENQAALRLPPLSESTLAVIRVKMPYTLINGSYLSHWSDVFPVRWNNPSSSNRWCSRWLSQEKTRADLSVQAACPCTLAQAESDTGRWQRDPLCSSQSSSQSNCIYRGSKAFECIVPTFRGSQTVNQRCCYDSNRELLDLREGGGGSVMERYHFRSRGDLIFPWFSYLQEEVAPFLHCCDYSSNPTLCRDYADLRPVASCQGYTPPAAAQAAGDPHIVTLDGLNYTFNGEGDFVLLQDSSGKIRVHVHAARTVDIDGQMGNATLFTAVAMSVVNETQVVEIRKDAQRSFAVLVDQEEKELPISPTGMTIYYNETGNGTADLTVVLDTVGISLLVSVTPDLLNIMVLVGSSQLKGNLTGLLGNCNGLKDDDFMSRQGVQIPVTSNMSDVHYLFGMTWYLERNDSLLYHPDIEEDSPTVDKLVPVFVDTLNEEDLRNGTQELCQGNLQCMFDYQLTGKESIAEATKQFNERYENLVSETAPVVRCPYIRQLDNGNRTLEGQAVGDMVNFTCNAGFKLTNGTASLVCLDTGVWSGSSPACVVDLREPDKDVSLYYAIAGAVGGFVMVIIVASVVWWAVYKYRRKYISKSDSGSETEQIELPTFFDPSSSPNPVFQNPRFLFSLQNLNNEGRYHLPRPRYVDPNIYTEYF